MRILLVETPFHSFMEYDRWYYPTSLAQIAAVTHATNHKVRIYDADRYFYKDPATIDRDVMIEKQQMYFDNVDNFDHPIWQHYLKTLQDFNPAVVGVSVFTSKLRTALNTLKLIIVPFSVADGAGKTDSVMPESAPKVTDSSVNIN